MRINDTNYGLYSYQNQMNRKNTTNISKKSTSSAEVEISSRGREISQAMTADHAQRQKRVQELKQQINNGTYRVDSNKIAEKMIDYWK
ncbi:flagellar biosynthesis anti-sigma factor FlgM [Bacillus salipaludis]|uniref:flagellar biosynthesis anti-sigma factor FlgM n=1 Tax=Bacillus salipaludis TaxID=2547811 RepID=UPI003D1F5259